MTIATQVIERALAAGVEHMMAIGTGNGPPDLEAGLRLAEKHPAFYATVGIHPHDAAKATPEDFTRLAELLAHPKVLAVGEIGLDYHYDFSPRDSPEIRFHRANGDRRCGQETDRHSHPRGLGRHAGAHRAALDAARDRRNHALFFGRAGGSAARARSRVLSELRRHCHVSQGACRSGSRAKPHRAIASSSKPMRPISPPFPSAASATSRR